MINLNKQIKTIYNDWGNDPYIYEKDKSGKYQYITYKEFIEKSLGIAKYLLDNNYKNKTIMLLSDNSINLMLYDLAITFFVGKSTILCKEWKKNDIEEGIKEIKADLLIYSDKYKDLAKNLNINTMSIENIDYPFTKYLLNLKVKRSNAISKIVFSSGTTGKSKGVKLTLKNIYSGLNSLQKRCHLTHDDYAYMFLPMHHTYASICHFMYSLVTGHRLYLASSTSNIAKELLETNPTIFCCVPLVLNNLYNAYKEDVDKAFGTNIRCVICGGAPLSKEIRKAFKDKKMCLMQTYAMTETSSSFTLAYPFHDDLESAGEIYEDIDVKVIDKDNNGIGEIIVKGNNVFQGYTNKELNKLVFDKNGYFHTGDLGYIKSKKLYIFGRKKKILVTSNGENVDAETIENSIKEKDSSIVEVKAYIKDDKIAVNIYVKGEIDSSIIDKYNEEVPKYERISSFTIYKDSIDTRLKH